MRKLLSASRFIVYTYLYRRDTSDMLHTGLGMAFGCWRIPDCDWLHLTSEKVLNAIGGE